MAQPVRLFLCVLRPVYVRPTGGCCCRWVTMVGTGAGGCGGTFWPPCGVGTLDPKGVGVPAGEEGLGVNKLLLLLLLLGFGLEELDMWVRLDDWLGNVLE